MERDSKRIAREWNREIEAEIRRLAGRRDDGWGRVVVWTVLELVWLADFLVRLIFGIESVGLTRYMFDPKIPLLVRGLSLFHVGLPFLLLLLPQRLVGTDDVGPGEMLQRALPACHPLLWRQLAVHDVGWGKSNPRAEQVRTTFSTVVQKPCPRRNTSFQTRMGTMTARKPATT